MEPEETRRESIAPGALSDGATDRDQLGFAPYVDAVAAFLMNEQTQPPLTISVEGDWGSGKSSFMKQLRAKLPPSVVKLEFNPWRHDKDEALWSAFALEFLRKVRRAVPLWRSLLGDVALFWKRLRFRDAWPDLVSIAIGYAVFTLLLLGLLHAYVSGSVSKDLVQSAREGANQYGQWVPVAAAIGAVIARARKLVGNPLSVDLRKYLDVPAYAQRVAFIEQVHADFKSVLETYVGNRRVVIFIDDLDRCDPLRAAELMQAINLLVADDPRLIFVIGMDREKVAAGLAVKFEKVIDYLRPYPGSNTPSEKAQRGIRFGAQFIEKFIQLPFLLPQPSAVDLRRLLTRKGELSAQIDPRSGERLQRLELELSEDSESVRNLVALVAEPFEHNPRRVKQFINLFRLRAYIASETGLFNDSADGPGLTLVQLAKLVAISMQWPELFEDAERNDGLLSGIEWQVTGRNRPNDQLVNAWGDNPLVAALLSYMPDDQSSIGDIDFQRILRVLPPVPRVAGREPMSEADMLHLYEEGYERGRNLTPS